MAPRTRPREQRGVKCGRCGRDEWVRYERDGGRWPDWRCAHCLRERKREDQRRRRSQHGMAERLYQSAKKRATMQGVPFRLTIDDVRAVIPPDGRCPALGIVLRHGQGTMHDASPTLDRLNPEWGYEAGNIAVLSLKANRAKGNLTATELEQIAQWMRSRGLN